MGSLEILVVWRWLELRLLSRNDAHVSGGTWVEANEKLYEPNKAVLNYRAPTWTGR
jgi:hypothetical protein